MRVNFDQHIGIFENALSSNKCDELINIFNESNTKINRKLELEQFLKYRNKDKNFKLTTPFDYTQKNDTLIYLEDSNPLYNSTINLLMEEILNPYIEKYFRAKDFRNYFIEKIKLQKTLPSQGFHVWHFENNHSEGDIGLRLLAYTIYLNDVEEGGETEFLFQSKRIKPTKGTICLFPAYFTHTHRGNPPLSGEKYIATGWIHAKS